MSVKWKAAMAANELAGAKAANAMEIDALQRYIEKLRTIPIPAGFEKQVNAMREILTGFIEFDRRQVDVATVADIVPAPEEGAPNLVTLADEMDALWLGLVKHGHSVSPSKC